jgi:hypothetical protein
VQCEELGHTQSNQLEQEGIAFNGYPCDAYQDCQYALWKAEINEHLPL